MKFIIFTDGASKGNPGRGGWGAIVAGPEFVTELGGAADDATNNQMELQATIEALRFAKERGVTEVIVYSDSSYVLNGISKWIFGWQKNGWKTSTKEVVQNVGLWQELAGLAHKSNINIDWRLLGGHIGIAGNEQTDRIASDFADGKKVDLYHGSLSQYPIDIANLKHDVGLHAAKASNRNHNKQKAYSYVSEVNGIVQVHKTWGECEARVKGKKARFKKALTKEDEQNIIAEFKM